MFHFVSACPKRGEDPPGSPEEAGLEPAVPHSQLGAPRQLHGAGRRCLWRVAHTGTPRRKGSFSVTFSVTFQQELFPNAKPRAILPPQPRGKPWGDPPAPQLCPGLWQQSSQALHNASLFSPSLASLALGLGMDFSG